MSELTDRPGEAPAAMARGLPVLHRDFGPPVTPGQPQAAHAQPVIDAIADAIRASLDAYEEQGVEECWLNTATAELAEIDGLEELIAQRG